MLKFYLSTIIIYAIVILSVCNIFYEPIKDNGWFNDIKYNFSHMPKYTVLFCISAIPVLRILMIIGIIYMAFNKKS